MFLFGKYGYIYAAILLIAINAIIVASAFPNGIQLQGDAARIVGIIIPYIAKTQHNFAVCGYVEYANYFAAMWLMFWISVLLYSIYFIYCRFKNKFFIPLGKNIIFNVIKLVIFFNIMHDFLSAFYFHDVIVINNCIKKENYSLMHAMWPVFFLPVMFVLITVFFDSFKLCGDYFRDKSSNNDT